MTLSAYLNYVRKRSLTPSVMIQKWLFLLYFTVSSLGASSQFDSKLIELAVEICDGVYALPDTVNAETVLPYLLYPVGKTPLIVIQLNSICFSNIHNFQMSNIQMYFKLIFADFLMELSINLFPST